MNCIHNETNARKAVEDAAAKATVSILSQKWEDEKEDIEAQNRALIEIAVGLERERQEKKFADMVKEKNAIIVRTAVSYNDLLNKCLRALEEKREKIRCLMEEIDRPWIVRLWRRIRCLIIGPRDFDEKTKIADMQGLDEEESG